MKKNLKTFKKDLKKYNQKYDKIAKRADAKTAAIYEERSRKINRESKRFNKKHPNFGKIVLAAMLLAVAFPFGVMYVISISKKG